MVGRLARRSDTQSASARKGGSVYRNPYLLELELQERRRSLRQQMEYLKLAAEVPRTPLRQQLAAALIALAGRLAPSLEVTVRPRQKVAPSSH